MYRETWYRALCMGRPVAPWRRDRDVARQDLIDNQLGSYDEWGTFYVTVPGGLKRKSVWVPIEAAA